MPMDALILLLLYRKIFGADLEQALVSLDDPDFTKKVLEAIKRTGLLAEEKPTPIQNNTRSLEDQLFSSTEEPEEPQDSKSTKIKALLLEGIPAKDLVKEYGRYVYTLRARLKAKGLLTDQPPSAPVSPLGKIHP